MVVTTNDNNNNDNHNKHDNNNNDNNNAWTFSSRMKCCSSITTAKYSRKSIPAPSQVYTYNTHATNMALYNTIQYTLLQIYSSVETTHLYNTTIHIITNISIIIVAVPLLVA